MLNSVLVFAGRAAIDTEEFRWQLLRVPEVSQILKEVQSYLDSNMEESVDLTAFLMSENANYLSSSLWRDLASQVVQVGLYRRYKKNSPSPRFLVGDTSEISALKVCIGEHSSEDMARNFIELLEEKSKEEQTENYLVGHSLENLKAYEYAEGELNIISENKETMSLLEDIAKDHIIDQVISIGSCDRKDEGSDNISIMESVSMDPMLSWLWPYLATA